MNFLITILTVFSLNFSSAGKEAFMDGKAKNIYFSKGGGGERGDGGVRDMEIVVYKYSTHCFPRF